MKGIIKVYAIHVGITDENSIRHVADVDAASSTARVDLGIAIGKAFDADPLLTKVVLIRSRVPQEE